MAKKINNLTVLDWQTINNAIIEHAKACIQIGINVEKGQRVIIEGPVEAKDFVRVLAKTAYDSGAGDVLVYYTDNEIHDMRIQRTDKEMLSCYPEANKLQRSEFIKSNAGYIKIVSPTNFTKTDINIENLSIFMKSLIKANAEYRKAESEGFLLWTLIGAANEKWAHQVFPDLDKDDAMQALWSAVLYASRTSNPEGSIKSWRSHLNNLHKYCDILNSLNLESLHYTNSLGTDLEVGLPDNHLWRAGDTKTHNGQVFSPNIPTEEVYCAPHKYKVNGVVYSTKKLICDGTCINNLMFKIKDGKIIEENASSGLDVLRNRLDTDEGSRYLGEIALVPYDSPISNLDVFFNNTLFDENSSCHIAFGMSFPANGKGIENKSKEELDKMGFNKSNTHVDFMIGSKDLNIIGKSYTGEEIQIFKNGNFAI